MQRYKPDFPFKLLGVDFSTLEESNNSIYALSKNLELIYFNAAFVDFALENGIKGDIVELFPIGLSLNQLIHGKEVHDFYRENYVKVLKSGLYWQHEYECSSPNEYRLFQQACYPLKNGEGLILSNALMVNLPINNVHKEVFQESISNYLHASGFIHQCSNCRRSQHALNEDEWHWVPGFVKNMPKNVSHTICPTCYDYYWKYSKINYSAPKILKK